VTADTGNDAVLGQSKNRVLALGPIVSYNTKVMKRNVALSFKYFREFAGKDRWIGNAFFFTAAPEI
jgi:hypothetical protein